jgi:Protein of unknown function (DUF1552)
MSKFTRRNMLQAAGLGLSSLALPSVGRTQGVDDLKLVFVYAEAGWTHRFYDMRPPWAPPEWSAQRYYQKAGFQVPDNLEWEFDLTDSRLAESDFSRLLKPLYRHRDVMIATEGLALLTTCLDTYGDAHAAAHIHAWSAVPAAAEDGVKSRGAAPSVDQRILEHIRQTDPGHLSMDFRPLFTDLFHEWLYRSDGAGGAARVSTESNPVAAYDRFFGNADLSNPLRANANLSLALAMEQFSTLAPKLSSEDRLKLEAHRDMLQTLDKKLGKIVTCDGIARPGNSSSLSRPERYTADLTSFMRMIVAGLSCGISRVATLGPIQPYPEMYGLAESTDIHHEYEHPTDPLYYYNDTNLSAAFATKEETMAQRNEMQMAVLADFIDMLRATPGSNGGTLLDTTLVVYLSELSHGNHGHDHFPSLIFGGGDTFSLGRYVKYAENSPNPYGRNYNNVFTGQAHSRLLISVLQSFGIAIDNFGVATVEGRAQGAPGDPRAQLALGGPLPRLKV